MIGWQKHSTSRRKKSSGAIKLITALEPKPGRNYGDGDIRYVTPDVYVHKIGDEYRVTLNEEGLPRLKVSNAYRHLLTQDGEAKEYVQEKLRAAAWLIKSIHQRQRTLLMVAESLVKFQQDFLNYGISHMRPLVLRDVADDIGAHESTVSRAIAGKYIATPRGVVPAQKILHHRSEEPLWARRFGRKRKGPNSHPD